MYFLLLGGLLLGGIVGGPGIRHLSRVALVLVILYAFVSFIYWAIVTLICLLICAYVWIPNAIRKLRLRPIIRLYRETWREWWEEKEAADRECHEWSLATKVYRAKVPQPSRETWRLSFQERPSPRELYHRMLDNGRVPREWVPCVETLARLDVMPTWDTI